MNTTKARLCEISAELLKAAHETQGEWILTGENTYECSNCGWGMYMDRVEFLYNFCPMCGKDMRETNKKYVEE